MDNKLPKFFYTLKPPAISITKYLISNDYFRILLPFWAIALLLLISYSKYNNKEYVEKNNIITTIKGQITRVIKESDGRIKVDWQHVNKVAKDHILLRDSTQSVFLTEIQHNCWKNWEKFIDIDWLNTLGLNNNNNCYQWWILNMDTWDRVYLETVEVSNKAQKLLSN